MKARETLGWSLEAAVGGGGFFFFFPPTTADVRIRENVPILQCLFTVQEFVSDGKGEKKK